MVSRTQSYSGYLLVKFETEGEEPELQLAATGERALKVVFLMIARRDMCCATAISSRSNAPTMATTLARRRADPGLHHPVQPGDAGRNQPPMEDIRDI